MIEWRCKFAFYTFFLSASLARTRALSWITQIIPLLGASIDGTRHAGPHDPSIACLRSLALLLDGIVLLVFDSHAILLSSSSRLLVRPRVSRCGITYITIHDLFADLSTSSIHSFMSAPFCVVSFVVLCGVVRETIYVTGQNGLAFALALHSRSV